MHDLFEPISRDERQAQALRAWIKAKGHGTIVGCTGFGKTRVAINAIAKLRSKYPTISVLVVVPFDNLREQWSKELDERGLGFNTDVRVMMGASKKEWSCDLLIIDEAHNILSYQSNRESESWKDYRLEVFEEIIKEGRKFGVFMTIASQRPSDISSTIISQLHNYFIHRLMNEKDIQQVNNTISYLDKVSVESLPILSTGVCVLAGQLAEMPIIVQIDRIEEKNKPQNETINLIEAWDE